VIRTLIVDDERHCCEYLSDLVGRYCPDLTIEGTAGSMEEALDCFVKVKPDLIFLDIRMPVHSGFDLLNHPFIKNSKPAIIFTTAYDQYAVKAFRYSAIDYLLKPVNITELIVAVQKAGKHIRHTDYSCVSNMLSDADVNRTLHKICLPTGSGYHLAEIRSIIYLKAEGSYARIFFEETRPVLICKPVSFYEEVLHDEKFMRVHRSYLVNLNHIVSFNSEDDFLQLSDKTRLTVSKRRKSQLVKTIREMFGS